MTRFTRGLCVTGVAMPLLLGLAGCKPGTKNESTGPTGSTGPTTGPIAAVEPTGPIKPHRPILKGHAASVNSVAFRRDGLMLASGSSDKTIKLWIVATGFDKYTLAGHTAAVDCVAFSPDGMTLVSGSQDKTVKFWDVDTRQNTATENTPDGGPKTAAFSPDGNYLAWSSYQSVVLWDVAGRKPLAALKGHTSYVRSVAFSTNSKLLFSCGNEAKFKIWDVPSGNNSGNYQESEGYNAVACSPDGTTLALGTSSGPILLWDIPSKKPIGTLTGHSKTIYTLAFSPDGKTLASGSWDETARLWDVSKRESKAVLDSKAFSVYSVAFSPDGTLLAAGNGNGTIILWDAKTGKMVGE